MSTLSISEFAARVVVALALAALAVVLWRIGEIIILIFGGLLLSLVLRTVMRIVERFTPVRGCWALLVAIVVLIVAVGLLGVLIVARLTFQVGEMRRTLPHALQSARAAISANALGRVLLHAVRGQATAGRWVERLGDVATITIGALVDAGVILFTGLYFAVDPRLYERGLVRLVPPRARQRVQRALETAATDLGHWLKGVLLSMLSIGVVTGLSLWMLGVPLALSLGILSGLIYRGAGGTTLSE